LSVWTAAGQWKGDDGSFVRESSYVLNLIREDDRESEVALREIIDLYKAKFRQEAVLRVTTQSCAAF
jgi:hypothetical protein